MVPWWTNQLEYLRNNKIIAWKTCKKSPTIENLVKFKMENAFFRGEIKKYKKIIFQNFTATINKNSSIKDIWSKVNRLSNNGTNNKILAIRSLNNTITDASQIAVSFADY